MDLHGARTSGVLEELATRFDAEAERRGWMVAYPDVLADGWESYGCCEHLEGARPARDSRLPQWDEPRDRRLHLAMGELYGWHCAAFAATDVWLAGREMRGPISGAGQIRILHRIKT